MTESTLFRASGVPLRVCDQIARCPSGPVAAEAVKVVFGVSGLACVDTPDSRLMLETGSVLAIPAGTTCTGTPYGEVRTVTFYFQSDYLGAELRWLSRSHPFVHLLHRSLHGTGGVEQLQLPDGAMQSLVPQLTRMVQLDALGGEEFALLSAAAQVADLVGRFGGAATARLSEAGLDYGLPRREVAAAMALLRQLPDHAWTVEEIAGRVALSPSQLTRLFRTQIGVSPATYLRQMRADRMAETLVSLRLGVAEAARLAGWHNPVIASRAFKRRYGVSPREFAATIARPFEDQRAR